MADIFDPLDITGFSDEDIAFLDLYMSAYLLREPFGILFRGKRDDYDDFQGAIRNPLWPNTLTPFGMEKELIVKSMDRLGPVFEQFCKETTIHGVKRKLDPFPMIANGFAECKAIQLRRLERSEEILRLQKENQGLANEVALLKGKSTTDESKIKELREGRASDQQEIAGMQRNISGLENELKTEKGKVAEYKESNAKQAKKQFWVTTLFTSTSNIITGVLGAVLGAVAMYFLTPYLGNPSNNVDNNANYGGHTHKETGRDNHGNIGLVEPNAPLKFNDSIRLIDHRLKDTQPHVNSQQRTFRQGK